MVEGEHAPPDPQAEDETGGWSWKERWAWRLYWSPSLRIAENKRTVAWGVGLAALGGLAYLISRDAETVLDYVKTLVWPVAVVLLVLLFRAPLSEMLRNVYLRRVKTGPLEAEFEQRETSTEDLSEILADYPDLIVEEEEQLGLEDQLGLEEQISSLRSEVALRTVYAELALLLNALFDSQLGLLQLLAAAPGGAPHATVQAYFEDVKRRNPALASWELNNLVGFLFQQNLTQITPEGLYILTQRGRALIGLANSVFHATKVI